MARSSNRRSFTIGIWKIAELQLGVARQGFRPRACSSWSVIWLRICRVDGDRQVDPANSVVSESDVPVRQGPESAAGGGSDPAIVGLRGGQIGSPMEQAIDAECGGLTASFEVRYVGGVEGDRIAAAQAKAVAALLRWLRDSDDIDPG